MVARSRTKTVTLTSRSSGESFAIHEELLCHYSAFYKASLQGPLRETSQRDQSLDCDPQILEMLSVWIYSGNLARSNGESPSTLDLVKLYVTADFYDFPALRNMITEEFTLQISEYTPVPSVEEVTHAFEKLPSTSKLCKLFVAIYISYFDGRTHDVEYINTFPKAFVGDVFKAQSSYWWNGTNVGDYCECCNGMKYFVEFPRESTGIAVRLGWGILI